ncbi:sensor histidine kinase [Spirosoma pulveris]
MVQNLLSNAFKFSQKDPRLTIHFSAHQVQLIVSDKEVGIPADALPLLFSKFFRPRNAGDFQGGGFGLVICQQNITLLRGRIDLTSTEGVDTMAIVSLPSRRGGWSATDGIPADVAE